MTRDGRIPVRNESMVRDVRTGALLSTDVGSFRAYEQRKRDRESQKDRLNRLEGEIADIKRLLIELIGKR